MKNFLHQSILTLAILTYFFSVNILGETHQQFFQHPDYNTAENQPEFLRFIGVSTKMGFVSTEFTGHSKIAHGYYTLDEQKTTLKNLLIKIPTTSLDTDNKSRDEKLHTLCINAKEHPEITAEIQSPIPLVQGLEESQKFLRDHPEVSKILNSKSKDISTKDLERISFPLKTTLKFKARTEALSLPTEYLIIENNGKFHIVFTTEFSFKLAQIQDPSIMVAKLEEMIKIQGHISIVK